MADPALPTPADLESAPLRHRFDDMFNPPGLTNFLGSVQVDHDLTAVRSVSFPPLGAGDEITGVLYLDGRLFRSYAEEVTVRWRPDRVVRSARVGDLELESVTACPPGETAVVVQLSVTNTSGRAREVELAFAMQSAVTRRAEPWRWSSPPSSANRLARDGSRLIGTSRETGAVCVQGVDHPCDWPAENVLRVSQTIEPGATFRLGFVCSLADDAQRARMQFDRLVRDVPAAIQSAEDQWTRELAGVFDPEGGGFSGSLPRLETSSDALRRLYWTGLVGVMYMRRDTPHSVLGRTYDTLMPRYWATTTFIWDYSLSSVMHALLDPEPMRRHLEHWIGIDIHAHYGTEWLSGGPIGVWYSVNDYAMTRLVRDYVRFNGRLDWLRTELATPAATAAPISRHVRDWSRHWQRLRSASGLADYGGVDNLLECVSTYVHEVAGLNAANVWCLRAAAEMSERLGDVGEATALREEADDLVQRVLELYVPGSGYWNARHADGTLVPVRHCYDFQTTGMALADDLGDARRRELVDFFVRELQTPAWMRALSASDPDAATSVRPDHQWNGAYTAWPAEAAQALFRLGADDVALDWLVGLAKSTAEGPFAQGHFVEGIVAASHDGAPKGPPQLPYLMDWACSSSGSFVGLILEGVFGVDVALDGTVCAAPRVGRLDPDARLRGLRVAGRTYDVDAAGARPLDE